MDAVEFLFQTGTNFISIRDAEEGAVLVQRKGLEHDLGLGHGAAGGEVEQVLAGGKPVVELESLAKPDRNVEHGSFIPPELSGAWQASFGAISRSLVSVNLIASLFNSFNSVRSYLMKSAVEFSTDLEYILMNISISLLSSSWRAVWKR